MGPFFIQKLRFCKQRNEAETRARVHFWPLCGPQPYHFEGWYRHATVTQPSRNHKASKLPFSDHLGIILEVILGAKLLSNGFRNGPIWEICPPCIHLASLRATHFRQSLANMSNYRKCRNRAETAARAPFGLVWTLPRSLFVSQTVA